MDALNELKCDENELKDLIPFSLFSVLFSLYSRTRHKCGIKAVFRALKPSEKL